MDVGAGPEGKYLSTGEVQEGKGSGLLRDSDQADDGKRAQTRRVARWTLVQARREATLTTGILKHSAPRTWRILKTTISLETSSQNRDLGGYNLRRLMLKMSVLLETSSQNGDVEIAGLIFGSSKMELSPETSSKKWDVEKAAFRPLMPKMSVSPETSSENGDVEIAGETFGSSEMSISPETSSKK